jgi:hypothetical protein
MLFSIFIGATATLYFVLRALIIKLKVVLSGGKAGSTDKTSYKYVIYNEGNQYWNVFKPVLDEFETREIELFYFTSAQDDPVFKENYSFIKSEFIGEGNKAFARLNLLSAGKVLMTTPGLDVYQLKRSRNVKHYSHVIHMVSDATTYRLFGLDYFDSVLLSGDYQKEDLRELEKQRSLPAKELVTVGCSYLDIYKQRLKDLLPEKDHPFTVLVSPSWGTSALLSRFGSRLLDPLSETGWRIIVRPHPQSKKSESGILNALEERYKDKVNILWDYERENIYSLSKADIMISDFSGIIFDYTFLFNKPVMYVKQGIDLRPYDADDINHELWQFKALSEFGIELKEEYFSSIKEVIQDIKDNPILDKARLKAKETAWQYPGEAGKRIADFLIETNNA